MIRQVTSLLVLICMMCPIMAQDNKMADNVKGLVKKMMDATVEGNYRLVLDMTHPKLLEMMGGKEAALKEIETMMKSIKTRGLKFQLGDIGSTSLGKNGEDVYSVTPSSLIMTGLGKKVTVKSAIIGVSSDGGASWKFINMDDKGEKGVRTILPSLPKDMAIPKQEQIVEDLK